MNNIIVIAYNGKKPTQQQIEAIAQHLGTLRCCDDVEIIQHYDKKSIVDIVGKGTTLIGFENHVENEALKNAATFINAHFADNAWKMFEVAANAKKTFVRTAEQEALLNAVEIIATSSREECAKYGIDEQMHRTVYNVKYYVLA